MFKGFISSTHGQEHFSLHQCVIYYFNWRFIFILLFGESFFSSGTYGLGFSVTVFTLQSQAARCAKRVLFCFKKTLLVFLKHCVGVEFSPCSLLSSHVLGRRMDGVHINFSVNILTRKFCFMVPLFPLNQSHPSLWILVTPLNFSLPLSHPEPVVDWPLKIRFLVLVIFVPDT